MKDYVLNCENYYVLCNNCCKFSAEHTETQDKEQNSTDSSLQTSHNSHAGPLRPPYPPYVSSTKSDVLRQEPQKKTQSLQMEDLPGPLITDQQNFALETKQEPEYVSTANIFYVIQTHERNVFLLFSVFWCFSSRFVGDEMFWIAAVTVGRDLVQ